MLRVERQKAVTGGGVEPQGCKAPCVLASHATSCGSRIAWSAKNIFGEGRRAWNLALDVVKAQCPQCSTCGPDELSTMTTTRSSSTVSTTTTTTTSTTETTIPRLGAATKVLDSIVARARDAAARGEHIRYLEEGLTSDSLPESQVNPSDGCDTPCFFAGHSATCKTRVQWSAANTFTGKPKACALAHSLVLSQCNRCSGCSLAS